ncbi:MAG: hypothetical protein H6R10_614 [Rhodocyclaceae bacterium]|nr:hypothetical protein [Rhodocyclaceae bacterium]
MNKLIAQFQRLYFLHGQQWHSPKGDSGSSDFSPEGVLTPEIITQSLAGEVTVALNLVSQDGMARTMAVEFEKSTDWDLVAKLYQGVQEDLDLPAPAVSVSGKGGYRVWFSLVEPVPVSHAQAFLKALRLKYLADIPPARLNFRPDIGEPASPEQSLIPLAPALHMATGKWSAFIDPSMGSMFVDEPWLEMAPNLDKQADLLAGFESIKAGDFQRVLNLALAHTEPAGGPSDRHAGLQSEVAHHHGPHTSRAQSRLDVGSNFSDPKSFLLAVMNDPSASAGQRIKAAKALLPYFHSIAPNR